MRRWLVSGVVLIVLLGMIGVRVATAPSGSGMPAAASDRDRGQEPSEEARGGNAEEAQEEAELSQERAEALDEAVADGRFGTVKVTSRPAAGWVGSQLLNPRKDDWEPAVAADPHAPNLYLLTTRYAAKPCPGDCPSPFIVLTRSTDGGSTWSRQAPLCTCRGNKAQYDPTIEVVPSTGAVYAAFLNGGFAVDFMKSTDHGRTWSTPVPVYGTVAWTDKPEIAASRTGRDVYISWNGPTGGDLYVSVSHDFGETWSQAKLVTSKRYYYAYDARVLVDGTAVFSESSVVYAGGHRVTGSVLHHLVVSRDGGRTWHTRLVAKVAVGEPCVADGCSPDFYIGQTSVAEDSPGHLVFAYEGAQQTGGRQRVWVTGSSDGGASWSDPVPLSSAGENATGPRLASSGDDDARIWYMQTSGGDDQDAWNVWYRESHDGGRTWSGPVRISDAPAGATGYVTADGFGEIYGDYGEIAVTNTGKTFAAWGEGFSYTGPGGTWFNLQR